MMKCALLAGLLCCATPAALLAQDMSPEELRQEIIRELDAWAAALDAAEAAPPAGSTAEVAARIRHLQAFGDNGPVRDLSLQIEQVLRENSAGWTFLAPPTPPQPTAQAPAPQGQAAVVETAPGAPAQGDAATAAPEPDPRPETQVAVQPGEMADAAPERLLSLPKAILARSDGQRIELPPFTILRVLGRDPAGIRVDAGANGQGIVREDATEEWNSMLVMQYAPLGGRERVLFFDDPEPIGRLLDSHLMGTGQVEEIYDAIRTERYDPDTLVAIEPARPVDAGTRPYFMPIIDHRADRFEDDNETPVFLLQLAAVNLQATSRVNAATPVEQDRRAEAEMIRDLRAGIVFAIDSTISMGPHIADTKTFMRSMRQYLTEQADPEKFGFGLVGYRDNTTPNQSIGYTTRPILPLQPVTSSRFEMALGDLSPSDVSTRDWREDAFAGLQDAIEGTDWTGYDARFVVLITDAGPRSVGDALARDARLGPRSIATMANQRGISLVILHILSDAGRSDHASAELAYNTAAQSITGRVPRYYVLQETNKTQLSSTFAATALTLGNAMRDASQGRAISADSVAGFSFDPLLRELETPGGALAVEDDEASRLVASAFETEIFRFQQEYLGRREGGIAPDFYRAWVADRDLIDPDTPSMLVKALLTRAQLGDLSRRLGDIIRQLENKEMGARDAFAQIARSSGRAAYDPEMSIADFLPSYIADLPYGSTFMRLTADQWNDLGGQQQDELLDQVRDRIRGFEAINRSAAGWLPLPGRAASEEVYPLDLAELP